VDLERIGVSHSRVSTAERFLLACAACAHEFRAPASLVGRRVACPYCAQPVAVSASAPRTSDDLIGRRLGGYQLTARIGAGALGLVYLGKGLQDGHLGVVKMLAPRLAQDESLVKRFLREARFCAQIQHPHVVRVVDCGFDRGINYLVMEYLDGGSLAAKLAETPTIPWQDTLPLIRQIALALEQAAAVNIVHRDIKPANILLTRDGIAKLSDLGLAKQREVEAEGAELTMQGMAIGTPSYMAPEQARNSRAAQPTADIYGLGATWYHLLCGEPPFIGRNGHEVLGKVLRERPRPLQERMPELPAGIAALVGRMLAYRPEDRPQTATALLAEIDAVTARPDGVGMGASAVAGWVPLAVGTGVVLIICGVVAWVLLR